MASSVQNKYREVGPNYFTLDPEHPDAKTIARSVVWYSPKFSPKDVPRFYDMASITERPEAFKACTDVCVRRYLSMPADQRPTHILGFDARGFILGATLAQGLMIPLVLLRKQNKQPGPLVQSSPYHKEYAEAHAEVMSLRLGAVAPGDRVVLVDDLIATGGTAVSGFELVESQGATVVEFVAITGIPFLNGVDKIRGFSDGKYKDVPVFTLIHDSDIADSQCGDPKEFDGPRVIDAQVPVPASAL